VAASDLGAATSVSAVENVDAELPFVLAPNTTLAMGSNGPQVRLLQERLSALGYWLGVPNGIFGDATQQAVYALEKVAGLDRSGVVGPPFVAALNAGAVPHPRTTSGDAIEVDLARLTSTDEGPALTRTAHERTRLTLSAAWRSSCAHPRLHPPSNSRRSQHSPGLGEARYFAKGHCLVDQHLGRLGDTPRTRSALSIVRSRRQSTK